MLCGKAVTHDKNVGNKPISNSSVINLFGARPLADGVAHVRVPRHCGINFLLRKKRRRLDAIFGVDRFVKDFFALIGAQP